LPLLWDLEKIQGSSKFRCDFDARGGRASQASGAIGGSGRHFPRARFRFRERGEGPLRSFECMTTLSGAAF